MKGAEIGVDELTVGIGHKRDRIQMCLFVPPVLIIARLPAAGDDSDSER